jgi:hypothetical protein
MIIATITNIHGDVFVKKVDGTTSKLSLGDTIEAGDIVVNGDASS